MLLVSHLGFKRLNQPDNRPMFLQTFGQIFLRLTLLNMLTSLSLTKGRAKESPNVLVNILKAMVGALKVNIVILLILLRKQRYRGKALASRMFLLRRLLLLLRRLRRRRCLNHHLLCTLLILISLHCLPPLSELHDLVLERREQKVLYLSLLGGLLRFLRNNRSVMRTCTNLQIFHQSPPRAID